MFVLASDFIDSIVVVCLQRWEEMAIDARLFLPSPNLFLPTDFSIKDPEGGVRDQILITMYEFL